MMIQFDSPKNLNGGKLIAELADAGITVNQDTSPAIDGSGNFWLDIDPAKEAVSKPIVAAHNGN